jgi:hypothetical protein
MQHRVCVLLGVHWTLVALPPGRKSINLSLMNQSDKSQAANVADLRVQSILDRYEKRLCTSSDLELELLTVCREQADATWQALALLDRMHRRSALPAEVFRKIKHELNQIVFCNTGKYVSLAPSESGSTPPLSSILRGTQGVANDDPEGSVEATVRNPAVVERVLRMGTWLNDRYLLIEPLAMSSATTLFKALDKQREALPEANRYVAVRWLDDRLQGVPAAATAIQNEYAQLLAIAHQNIAKPLDVDISQQRTHLVLEWYEGAWLSAVIDRFPSRRLPMQLAMSVIRDIGLAVAHAHSKGIAHGGLHPECVRITQQGELRVFDFARADAWIGRSKAHLSSTARRYASPQVLTHRGATIADDMFSLAAIAYELLLGATPNTTQLAIDGKRPISLLGRVSHRQWRALCAALSHSAHDRPSDVRAWLTMMEAEQTEWSRPVLSEWSQIRDDDQRPLRAMLSRMTRIIKSRA